MWRWAAQSGSGGPVEGAEVIPEMFSRWAQQRGGFWLIERALNRLLFLWGKCA